MPFNQLKQQYSTCDKCEELCKDRIQVVFGAGNKDADVLFIGEAPGANEAKQGIPFCGMSGKILNELLDSAGLSREDIFITNTVLVDLLKIVILLNWRLRIVVIAWIN